LVNVVGAHIPDLSSEVGFLDAIYLGIFLILAPAFDVRFYDDLKPPSILRAEYSYAVAHFFSLLHFFSLHYIILLQGELVGHFYILDRMLGEFAAAAVLFSKGIDESKEEGGDVGAEERIFSSDFSGHIENILQQRYPNAFRYFSRCIDRRHKDFVWTGPKLEILSRSDDILSIIPITTMGERQDYSAQPIYSIDLDPSTPSHVGKRRNPDDGMNVDGEQQKKRKRQPR
jgi:hypothetical protein